MTALRCLVAAFGAMLGLAASSAWADGNDYVAIARGRYLAVVGDCTGCHHGPAGDFAGGMAIETPFGNIRAANITPDRETGIGSWSSDDFARAMHEGVGPDGRHLYPAFPYPWFTRISRADSDAIFAFLQTVPPATNVVDRNTLPFPFSVRTGMRAWNVLFFDEGRFQPDPQKPEEWNRGAYLVEGLAHCGACHTPVNMLGGSRGSEAFAGQALQGWVAPNISGSEYQGIGGWGVDDIVQYLATGANAWTRASGPMADVVAFSTSRMDKADLRAIAVYLQDQKPQGVAAAPTPLAADAPQMVQGQMVYVDNCSACHKRDGTGVEGMIPSLAANQIVVQPGIETLARVVVAGSRSVATDAEPTAPGMPSFGWRLSDAQVADVLTFIRNSFGNGAPAVAAEAVAGVRRQVTARTAN